jgi:hypothetical protein
MSEEEFIIFTYCCIVDLYDEILQQTKCKLGQLCSRFNIEKVWARDILHLTNRVTRKILSHTMAIFVNQTLGRKPLQFDGIIKI